MGIVAVVVTALWAMLPAYIPNNVAVIVGGGRPIDGGRTWRGHRLLGDGKTWRGLFGGWVAGAVLALVLNQIVSVVGTVTGVALQAFPPGAALGLPLGALLGDILGSFVKRRTGRDRGAPFPGIDQLDFVAGALLLGLLVAPSWFATTFTPPVLGVVVVLTPVLHVVTNVIGYLLGLKAEPW